MPYNLNQFANPILKFNHFRHYSYPDLAAYPKTYARDAERPGGGTDVYAWSDNPEILAELGTTRLASVAKWQPETVYPIDLENPGKHVLAVAFFTPKGTNPNATTEISVLAKDAEDDDSDATPGKAFIFDCRYSTLCRQVNYSCYQREEISTYIRYKLIFWHS